MAGLIFVRGMKLKLWDYSDIPGNIRGIICPLFSLLWTAAAAIYILFIHRFITGWVGWFVNHLGFAFFVGLFFGVFIIDLCHSVGLSVKIRKFAAEHNIVVHFEKLKLSIKEGIERGRARASESLERARGRLKKRKASFLFSFRSDKSMREMLADYLKEREAGSPRRQKKGDGAEVSSHEGGDADGGKGGAD